MSTYWNTLKLFNWNVRYFLMAAAVHGFVFFGIYSLLLNLYLLRLGYESEYIGLVNGLGPFMLAVFSLPAGAVSRRWGSRRVMIWSYFILAISFGLVPLSEWLPNAYRSAWIVGSYALVWISAAFLIVNLGPYLMTWTSEEERNHAFALQAASMPVAGFLGSFLGGTLPNIFASFANVTLNSPIPYRNALLVASVIELLTGVILMRTSEAEEKIDISTSNQHPDETPPPYRLIVVFAIVNMLAVAGEWTMRVYFNVYLDRALSTPTTIIGVISASAQLMGLTAFLVPLATARWGRNRIVQFGLFSVFIAFVPLILIAHWLAVGIGYMILLAVLSLTYPTLGVFSQSAVKPQWRTAIASAMSMSVGIGVAITSLSGGYVVAAFGYQTLFILGASAGILGSIVVWRYLPQEKSAGAVPVSGTTD